MSEEEQKAEGGGRKRKKTALLASLAVIFCLVLGGVWIGAYFHGKKALEENCEKTYSAAQKASKSFEGERAAAQNALDTSTAPSSAAYASLKKALGEKTDSSPAMCSAGARDSIEANRSLIKSLSSRQASLSSLAAELLDGEKAQNASGEKALAELEIKAAQAALPALSESSKSEVESRMRSLQDEIGKASPSLSGIKDAMLALEGSLKAAKAVN